MSNESGHYMLKVTETAWDMLISHARFNANISIAAANKLVDDFLSAAESLSFLPERGVWLEHDAIAYQKYRKHLFSKYYLILYEIQEEIVYIVAVVDCRQDYVWLLY